MKATDNFIKNAGKSTEKPAIECNAFTSKPERHSDRFNITREDVCWIVAMALFLGYVTYVSVKG